MLKSRKFKRKAVCLGLTATLIAGFAVTFVVPISAVFATVTVSHGNSPLMSKGRSLSSGFSA